MIPLRWDEIEALELGELRGPPADGVIRRVHDDSRVARPGDLFVALNTGSHFVDDALARGAATLVPRRPAGGARRARVARPRPIDAQVVAVVGSTGKTSTKDALARSARPSRRRSRPRRARTTRSASRSPCCGSSQRPECSSRRWACAVSARSRSSARSPGPTSSSSRPSGPSTSSSSARSRTSPARTPRRSRRSLRRRSRSSPPTRRSSSRTSRAGARRAAVRHAALRATARAATTVAFSRSAGDELRLELPFNQRHLAENVLAALTAYDALGLPLDRAQEGADADRALARWRGEVRALPGGGVVVNDAYNANPTSMRAALARSRRAGGRAAARRDPRRDGRARRRERPLPRRDRRAHRGARNRARGRCRRAGARLPRRGRDGHLWIATRRRSTGPSPTCSAPGDAILVKASRAVGLEGIPALIEKLAGAWSESSSPASSRW